MSARREEFRQVLAKRQAAADDLRALWSREHPLAVKLRDAIVARARTLNPRIRDMHFERAVKLLGDKEIALLKAPLQTEYDALYEAATSKRDRAELRLVALADTTPVLAGPPRVFHEVRASEYHNQGYGASRYAEGAAEEHADVARAAGIEVTIAHSGTTRFGGAPWWSMQSDEKYVVLVHVAEELDVEILRRRPPLPLREWVRRCWQRGVNPRVYSPMLPVGYEEQAGLDYYGGEK